MLDDIVAPRLDLDVNLVRVLVGARLARPDVLHASAKVLHIDGKSPDKLHNKWC